MLYELAEKLVDFEDYFRRWRFNHVTTVERIIGFKRGTGGTGGVSYLQAHARGRAVSRTLARPHDFVEKTMTRLRVYDDTKALFHLPDGVIYLDGNSLGALPLGVAERVSRVITAEWGNELIRAWNTRRLVCPAAPCRRPHRAG